MKTLEKKKLSQWLNEFFSVVTPEIEMMVKEINYLEKLLKEERAKNAELEKRVKEMK